MIKCSICHSGDVVGVIVSSWEYKSHSGMPTVLEFRCTKHLKAEVEEY